MYLQVKINDNWEYVFCRNSMQSAPVTTKNKKHALKADALKYFELKFGNHEFRLSK